MFPFLVFLIVFYFCFVFFVFRSLFVFVFSLFLLLLYIVLALLCHLLFIYFSKMIYYTQYIYKNIKQCIPDEVFKIKKNYKTFLTIGQS